MAISRRTFKGPGCQLPAKQHPIIAIILLVAITTWANVFVEKSAEVLSSKTYKGLADLDKNTWDNRVKMMVFSILVTAMSVVIYVTEPSVEHHHSYGRSKKQVFMEAYMVGFMISDLVACFQNWEALGTASLVAHRVVSICLGLLCLMQDVFPAAMNYRMFTEISLASVCIENLMALGGSNETYPKLYHFNGVVMVTLCLLTRIIPAVPFYVDISKSYQFGWYRDVPYIFLRVFLILCVACDLYQVYQSYYLLVEFLPMVKGLFNHIIGNEVSS